MCRCPGVGYTCASLKFTAQKFYSHGDGAHPVLGDDSDEAGKNRRIDVVLHVIVVICISKESLDLMRERHCLESTTDEESSSCQ